MEYKYSIEKKLEIIETVDGNYRISRRVYRHLYGDINDIFIEYIHSLDIDEIQGLDDGLKTNRWGAKTLLEIEDAYELLTIFQIFYYFKGSVPLTV